MSLQSLEDTWSTDAKKIGGPAQNLVDFVR